MTALYEFQKPSWVILMCEKYRRAAHFNVTHRRRQNFYALPSKQWEILAAPPFLFLDTLLRVDDAIDANADIADAILRAGLEAFGLEETPQDKSMDWRGFATPSDLDKAQTTIRQLYRDWSIEGAAERQACYRPVLDILLEEFSTCPDKGSVKVLVPGAGLGRLVFEINAAGFCTEGNEISYHQLIASSFILNHTRCAEQLALYPWALSFSNHSSREHQLQKVMVPDVHPAAALAEASQGAMTHAFERLSMSAADFTMLYGDAAHNAAYDAVATVFFIDTAPNLFDYIETIKNCLREGGIWINLGPLLWHFEDSDIGAKRNLSKTADTSATEEGIQISSGHKRQNSAGFAHTGSVELTDNEVILLLERSGFKLEKHIKQPFATGYIQNPRSMLQNIYEISTWVARRIK
ncbi:N2227-domain-containing protein [Xylona heveae TC161]|uniref:carnosine N-methyltransferase n=1 Tax=Xylona heveae (strain CBS 132557 / TC161) TaxID=1328760 RepID=A0A165HYU3_XYLHT|nr:N2227-domain-containing protein [Xylona heveae TC161]KZF24111.1 N2227-domain-containing protein [Xylona heveae TC161]